MGSKEMRVTLMLRTSIQGNKDISNNRNSEDQPG